MHHRGLMEEHWEKFEAHVAQADAAAQELRLALDELVGSTRRAAGPAECPV